jgi:thiol-disulfide isomerase/thioredoxin
MRLTCTPAPRRAAWIVLLMAAAPAWAGLANDVQALVTAHQLPLAIRGVRAIQAQQPAPSAEMAAALSWLARGALDEHQVQEAEGFATEARAMALRVLGMRRLDSDPFLPTAVGAAVEVHAGVLQARGQKTEALAFLRQELKTWNGSSIEDRIQKNINLLSLVGSPAPPLEGFNLASLKGHPVLLFFWAHWCPDCKADVPVIAEARKRFAPQGLTVVGPTRLYGYVSGGDPAPPDNEKQYIEQVRRKYYAPLDGMPTPLSAGNFERYGASTTPTIVLLDRAGVVRYYHPGAVTLDELTSRIAELK